jgi:hypothetical protein
MPAVLRWHSIGNRDHSGLLYDGPIFTVIQSKRRVGPTIDLSLVRRKDTADPLLMNSGVGQTERLEVHVRARVWRFKSRSIALMLDGVQYVSVLAGWGGPSGLFNGPLAGAVRPGYGRILAFKLGGTAALPARPFGHAAPPESPTAEMAEPALVKAGGALYGAWLCALPWLECDRRPAARSSLLQPGDPGPVRGDRARRESRGSRPSFRTNLNAAKVRAIRAFVMARIAESGAK